jgi:hypothetical protein
MGVALEARRELMRVNSTNVLDEGLGERMLDELEGMVSGKQGE